MITTVKLVFCIAKIEKIDAIVTAPAVNAEFFNGILTFESSITLL